ncbi:helicase-related protein [Asticcacaulis sp. AC402]|uniref:helicase-related protein n=1 Tax=Asticcacaulis sp. AC402 TaxID=1282361 RepID=UPI0003C3BBA8|nr:helicase-related protein [Asticcacaulis sp. AC402]ESQ74520.1 helicase [Asticcacaulis sp. AC402]
MSDLSPTRPLINAVSDARLAAVLGPTNTGKTHYAIERMCGYATGMIGLPLRLLAREIYDRVVALKGVNAVALVTGEEKIIPRLPSYFVCTVEAMPLERQVDFMAVDEIQLCGDAERGHVFTDRLLHARGRFETLFLGANTFAPLFHRLFPAAEIIRRERLSSLSYSGSKKLTRLPKRTAIVAFSTEKVYAIAELIRRQRGGAAVVMGSLSPKTRNAQVELFQKGEVDFLVATDAIGMGLNMDIAHVAFSGFSKFDGKNVRHLTAQEIGQIAGRAGRHMNDGTFGVTGECHELDDDLVEQVQSHAFAPLEAAQWRNHKLDFSTLDTLLKSLTLPSHTIGLHLAKEALDERTLRMLAADEEVALKVRNPVTLRTLWDVCQLPDFRKTGLDEHLKLVSHLFWSRLSPEGVVAEDWFETQIRDLDHMDGDIDTLSSRLSGVRTLSYISNRGNWLKRNDHWRDTTRDLEERLSDRLHEALMQRFIDARTAALLKALDADEVARPEVTPEGQVIIEGHAVGELKGLTFKLSNADSVIADKTLRQAANRAVLPVLHDRLRALAQTASKSLHLRGHTIDWNKEPVARIEPSDWFAPKVKLLCDIDNPALAERALKRVSDFVRIFNQHQLKGLYRVKQAADAEGTLPQVRAIAFQLYENGGLVRRDEAIKLTPEDKAALKALGVAGHRYAWFLPEALNPKMRQHMRAFGVGEGPRAQTLRGLLEIPDHGPVSLKALSQVDKIVNSAIFQKGALYMREADFAPLGLNEDQRDKLMLALGFVKVPPQTFPVVVHKPKPEPVVAEVAVAETPVEDAPAQEVAVEDAPAEAIVTEDIPADIIAEPIETAAEHLAEVIEAAPAVEDAPSDEVVATEPAQPEMEERLGWRQKSLEPRPPRPRRDKPQGNKEKFDRERFRPPAAEGAEGQPVRDRNRPPKFDKTRDQKRGGEKGKGGNDKGGNDRGDKPRGPKPEPQPYINPYSPFAILREKLGQN